MMYADLIIRNTSQVVTVAGNGKPKKGAEMKSLKVIDRGAVAVSNGKIVWTGAEKSLPEPFANAARTIDAEGCAVLPGLVDCHTHLVFSGTREDEFAQKIAGVPYMEIAAKGGGIKRTVRTTRAASEQELLALAEHRIREFLKFGVTCMEFKSGYGLDLETEQKILTVAGRAAAKFPIAYARTFLGAHEIPPGKSRREYLDEVCNRMIPRIAEENLAEFCDVFCEKKVFSVPESRRVLETGLKHGLAPKIHTDQMTSIGGTELAAELEAVSADHLDHITDSGISALIQSGTIGVILPGAVFFLGLNQYAPARKMMDSGMAIAISTDFNPGSCMSQNLHLMMTIACTQCRMTVEEVITACTLNAAFAMGRGKICGSIEPGKRADLIILDTDRYEMLPYHFGHNHVRTVICAGQPVIENFEQKI